jgi:hypothetical protein
VLEPPGCSFGKDASASRAGTGVPSSASESVEHQHSFQGALLYTTCRNVGACKACSLACSYHTKSAINSARKRHGPCCHTQRTTLMHCDESHRHTRALLPLAPILIDLFIIAVPLF